MNSAAAGGGQFLQSPHAPPGSQGPMSTQSPHASMQLSPYYLPGSQASLSGRTHGTPSQAHLTSRSALSNAPHGFAPQHANHAMGSHAPPGSHHHAPPPGGMQHPSLSPLNRPPSAHTPVPQHPPSHGFVSSPHNASHHNNNTPNHASNHASLSLSRTSSLMTPRDHANATLSPLVPSAPPISPLAAGPPLAGGPSGDSQRYHHAPPGPHQPQPYASPPVAPASSLSATSKPFVPTQSGADDPHKTGGSPSFLPPPLSFPRGGTAQPSELIQRRKMNTGSGNH